MITCKENIQPIQFSLHTKRAGLNADTPEDLMDYYTQSSILIKSHMTV